MKNKNTNVATYIRKIWKNYPTQVMHNLDVDSSEEFSKHIL